MHMVGTDDPDILHSSVLLTWMLASMLAGRAENIRIAVIDPFSGPAALQGEMGSRHIQMAVDDINARGGVLGGSKLELVLFDNKSSPQESLVVLKQAIDQDIRLITQGVGSHVAHAMTDAVLKYNQRNPGRELLYLNNGATDTALTEEKCNFWHFRFDANLDMKIDALTRVLSRKRARRKLYLINQDYAYGHSFKRVAREMLAAKRPDIEIVGDELIPLGKVKDFAPYVAKIKSSGADVVLTGNWGSDLALLIKAAEESGLNATFYTNYGFLVGTPRLSAPPVRTASRRLPAGTRTSPAIPGALLPGLQEAVQGRLRIHGVQIFRRNAGSRHRQGRLGGAAESRKGAGRPAL
jgi:branched-chain amino acid transport system substrate-binding protein